MVNTNRSRLPACPNQPRTIRARAFPRRGESPRLVLSVGWRIAAIIPAAFVLNASAASSWGPTLLVNTEAFQVIDDRNSASNLALKFGQTLNKNLTYDRTTGVFRFDDDLWVPGTVSGSVLRATTLITSSGSVHIEGTLTGATIAGFGLTDCDADTQSLGWDPSAGKFTCGDDDSGGSGGHWSGTGALQAAFDARYLNQSGDTMTGALTIDIAGEGMTALSISGALVFNESGLDNDARFEGSTDESLVVFDAGTDRVGIGTNQPQTKLEVAGTVSGSALSVNGALNVNPSGVITGATMDVRQNAITSVSGALVWYIDGTLAPGTEQGIAFTLPVAFAAKTVELDLKTGGHPSGQSLIIDINEAGSTIFSTRPEIDAGSTTEDANHAFSDASLGKGARITLDIDQVGSTKAGTGLTVILKGTFDM